jgi:hypothetical protein
VVPTRVFISYARTTDDSAHDDAVRELWRYLRANGVDARLDLPAAEVRQDWAIWMLHEIHEAQYVLVIASAAYRQRGEGSAPPSEGRGLQWEAALIREEGYADRERSLRKYLPIVLPGRSVDELPNWLGPTTTTHYDLTEFPAGETERLLRVLTDQPYERDPPIGAPPVLPPRSDPPAHRAPTQEDRPRTQSGLSTGGVSDFTEPHLVAPLRRLFLHFFDPHFLDEVSHGRNLQLVETEAVRATRLAVLAAETVFVPAASYIESDLCANTVNDYRALFEVGQIVLVGGEANLVDFAMTKLLQYEQHGERFRRYEAILSSNEVTPPFRPRTRSATRDIAISWHESLSDLSPLLAGIPAAEVPDLENRWAAVPIRLESKAFTPEYAIPTLFAPGPRPGAEMVIARRVGSKINADYFRSYTAELDAGLVTELTYLRSPHARTSAGDLPFQPLMQTFTNRGVLDLVLHTPAEQLMALRGSPQVSAAMAYAIETARGTGHVQPS